MFYSAVALRKLHGNCATAPLAPPLARGESQRRGWVLEDVSVQVRCNFTCLCDSFVSAALFAKVFDGIVTSFTEHKPGGMKMAELNPTDSKSTLMQASPNCLAITI